MKKFLLILISFVMIALAQPDWSPWACVLASTVGYGLFWKGMLAFASKITRFCLATVWYGSVSLIHLNWFLADRYVGFYIYFFLAFLFFWLGLQFGIFSFFVGDPLKMSKSRLLALSGLWVLLEWQRLYWLSGFSWDPVGLALTATLTTMQMASIAGIYGLSFWVFLTNLWMLKCCTRFIFKNFIVLGILIAFPYSYGSIHLFFHKKALERDSSPPITALLVQTSLLPEEKVKINGSHPFSPFDQWVRILNLVSPFARLHSDLIIFPEGVVPYGTNFPLYDQNLVSQSFMNIFENIEFLPKWEMSYLGNRDWAQALANAYNTHVVIGLEDIEISKENGQVTNYNTAFMFRPHNLNTERYEKRILVPMGEYIPFSWCKKILSKYGITDSYSSGKKSKLFQIKSFLMGVSICYEETFGQLMRSNRKQGAEMLINLTNDVWYPHSRLPYVHYMHSRLRAIELGVPLLRACNTGVTCGIDALGRTIGQLPYDNMKEHSKPGVLSITLSTYQYQTLYTLFGDWLVITVSFCSVLLNGFILGKKDFYSKIFKYLPLAKN